MDTTSSIIIGLCCILGPFVIVSYYPIPWYINVPLSFAGGFLGAHFILGPLKKNKEERKDE